MKHWLIISILTISILTTTAASMRVPQYTDFASEIPVKLCIRHWQWYTLQEEPSFWGAPDRINTMGIMDFRSIPQMAQKGGPPEGYGIFVYDADIEALDAIICITPDLQKPLAVSEKIALELGLGLDKPLSASKPADIIWELMTAFGDPEGLTGWRPITPYRGHLELRLAPFGVIGSDIFTPSRYPNINKVAQIDYRRIRTETIAEKHVENFHRKYLTTLMRNYKISEAHIIPSDLPLERPILPATVITETWNCSDADELDCDVNWTEYVGDVDLVSNEAHGIAENFNKARTDDDLSSDNATSTIDVVGLQDNGPNPIAGVAYRVHATDDTAYEGLLRARVGGDGNRVRLYKTISGSQTELCDGGIALTIPDEVMLTTNGSTIRVYINDNLECDVTDSAITGNTKGGTYNYISSPAATSPAETDNPNFDDGVTPPPPPTERRIYITLNSSLK